MRALWGPTNLALLSGSTLMAFEGGTFTPSFLFQGFVNLGGLFEGFASSRTAVAFSGPITTTPGNLDASGGLQDPISGSAIRVNVGIG